MVYIHIRAYTGHTIYTYSRDGVSGMVRRGCRGCWVLLLTRNALDIWYQKEESGNRLCYGKPVTKIIEDLFFYFRCWRESLGMFVECSLIPLFLLSLLLLLF